MSETKDGLLRIPLCIDSKNPKDPPKALLDTGANCNLISSEYAAQNLDNIDIFTGGNDDALFGSIYHYQRRNGQDVTDHPVHTHSEYENPPDKNPGELSCQDRAKIEGGTQLLATNMAVAAFLLGRVQKTIVSNQNPDEAEIYFDLGIGKSEPYDRRLTLQHVVQ